MVKVKVVKENNEQMLASRINGISKELDIVNISVVYNDVKYIAFIAYREEK